MNTANGFTITIDGFINPIDNKVLNAFTIKTFDDAGQTFKVDQISDLQLYPKTPCLYPCRECLTTN
jgi:hypothetical protein